MLGLALRLLLRLLHLLLLLLRPQVSLVHPGPEGEANLPALFPALEEPRTQHLKVMVPHLVVGDNFASKFDGQK